MRAFFRSLGLSSLQLRVIALCILINMLDGFDIMAMAYSAPALAKLWSIPSDRLGVLFSAGLAGMVVGSMVIGTLADRLGRRPMILACLAIAALGMFASSQTGAIFPLGIARFVTGIAIGGMLPCINTMVAEYASPRSRSMAVALMQAGFAIGASAGGFLSVWLLGAFGWQAVFLTGGVLTALMVPLVFAAMPESLAYLAARPDRAGEHAALLARMNEVADDPSPDVNSAGGWRNLAAVKVPLTYVFAIFFFCIMVFYFLNSWIPKILTDAGLSQSEAVSAGALLTAGGIIAAIALGWLSLRRSIIPIVAGVTLMSAIMTGIIGQLPLSAGLLLGAAFVLGLFTNATQIGIYAIIPGLFPPRVRASATGLAIGMGRLGSVIGPWAAGLMLAKGVAVSALFLLMALPYALAALLILRLRAQLKY